MSRRALTVRHGFASERGRRPDNQDYVAIWAGQQVVAALADGVGGHKGGRQAAETTVRGFLDAYLSQPETLGVQKATARALEPLNRWVHAQGRTDPELAGMACAFAALILHRRSAHVSNAGDCRVWRFADGALERLTEDHALGRGDLAHALTRAVGFEASIKLDHRAVPIGQHDRFLMTSDGAHGSLGDTRLAALMGSHAGPQETAEAIVAAALAAGSRDNVSALVLDIDDLPTPGAAEVNAALTALPIAPLPNSGDGVDGFTLGPVISEGRYSRVFKANDAGGARTVAIKFPHLRVATEESYRLAFVREAWIAARVRSPYVGEALELPRGRQSRLYAVMPFYEGETFERRLRGARLGLREVVAITVKLARGLDALHRAGIVHRDVKPENVILAEDGGVKLIDLGVAYAAEFDEFSQADAPGTPSYMAPELFAGERASASTDLYALGVTAYRALAVAYPYGEVEPFMTPRFDKYAPLVARRPDLPAWLDTVVARAVAPRAADRYGDVLEFAHELEAGIKRAAPARPAAIPLYERDPLRFWQVVAAILAMLLIAVLARDAGFR